MSTHQSASTDVLAFVGGKDENIDDRNSAFPDTNPFLKGTPGHLPIDDTMFYGDGTGTLPENLADAKSLEKHVDGLNGTYRKYRFKNSIWIDYDTTTDNKIKNDTIRVTVNSQKPKDTVAVADSTTGSTNSFKAPLNLFLPDNPEPPSYTILASDWKEKSEKFAIAFDSQKRRAATYGRHVKAEKGVFQSPGGGSIQGVRAATIWGSSNPYTRDLVGSIEFPNSFMDWAFPDNPIIYSWMELTLLADGTTYVRIPDASVFPKHVGYLRPSQSNQNTKRDTSGLEYILDKNANPTGDTYAVAIREDTNHVWKRFKQENNQGLVVPYKGSNSHYHANYKNVDSSLYDHPVMAYGETSDGRELNRKEVLNKLPQEPLFPMEEIDFTLIPL